MTIHALKTTSENFNALVSGAKTCELRHDDRGYEVGDLLVLVEWFDGTTSKRTLFQRITHITHVVHWIDVEATRHWAVLSLAPL